MNEGHVSTHLRSIADEAVPTTVDLWAGIEEQVAALPRPLPARPRAPRLRLVGLAGALILLLALAVGNGSPAAAAGRDVRDVVFSTGHDVLVTFGVITALPTNVTTVTPDQCTPVEPQPSPFQPPAGMNLPEGMTPGVMVVCNFTTAPTTAPTK